MYLEPHLRQRVIALDAVFAVEAVVPLREQLVPNSLGPSFVKDSLKISGLVEIVCFTAHSGSP